MKVRFYQQINILPLCEGERFNLEKKGFRGEL